MGLRSWLRRRPSDDEMREEVEAHVAMRAEYDRVDEAAARRRLGSVLRTREAMRRVWIPDWWDELRQDAWFTLRSWRRQPGFALSAVLVLALGLGASTAMFSAIDRILFRSFPYADADRIVNFGWTTFLRGPGRAQTLTLVGRGYLERWKPAPAPFSAVTTVINGDDMCDVTEREPERLRCANVESNFLGTLGVRPALGRDFTADDDVRGAPAVAIISHAVWRRRFGSDPGAIGRTIALNGKAIPVIGVLPAAFEMPTGNADILRPQQIYPLETAGPPLPNGQRILPIGGFLTAFGRLKPGVTPQQAKAAISALIEENGNGLPRVSKNDLQPAVLPLREFVVGDAARLAWLLLGAVGGLLLIACVNVANLILARLAARTREFTVRSALGAGRARLARLALTESLLLAVAGGGFGLLFAAGMLRVFVRLAPSSIPELDHASLDPRVFGVAAVLALVVGAAVGIWPALSVLRSRALQYGPRATAAPRPRLRFTLVTAQIALTMAMLASSALLLRTLWNLVSVPLGYDSERIVTMSVALNPVLYPLGERSSFFERLLQRIRATPGTAAAAMTVGGLSAAGGALIGVRVDGKPLDSLSRARPPIRPRQVSPDYFRTFGIPILRGRAFAESDWGGQPVAILSESAAQILFPGQDPLGHTVYSYTQVWVPVVGVARDIRNNGPAKKAEPELYTLWPRGWVVGGFSPSFAYFGVRTQAGPESATAFLKQAVADLDPRLPVTIRPLDDEVARLTERPRFLAWLLSTFAALALLLAAVGLYGVASYLVTQRTRDIGVRMALGAAPGDVARLVIGEAGRWIAAGAVGGALLAWGVTQAIKSQLFEVTAADPVSWAAALAVLAVALLAAVARPAGRAAHVDPIVALRAD